jgi:hypothetical protein
LDQSSIGSFGYLFPADLKNGLFQGFHSYQYSNFMPTEMIALPQKSADVLKMHKQ